MKRFKKIGKAFVVAFSIYSKIPMPRFQWESEDMKYHLCFFPWVGAVIGGAEWLWYRLCGYFHVTAPAMVLLALAIPVFLTGGFHLDGFMDTMDALHSYQDKEKKLAILKDPHIGAFAVISLLTAFLTGAAFLFAMLSDTAFLHSPQGADVTEAVSICCMGFFLSRALSGISVVTMRGAKEQGMLQTFSTTAQKRVVLCSLSVQLCLCAVGMLLVSMPLGAAALLGAGGSYLSYWHISKKQFGGITGDLAGCFVTVTEFIIVVLLGCFGIFTS